MLDESQTQAGLSSEEGQASAEKGGTSAKAPKTYTEKEYSDALSKAGRDAVDRVKGEMQEQIRSLQSQLDERDEAGIDKSNPDALSNFQLKKQIRDLNSRIKSLEAEKADLTESANKGKEYEQLEFARKIAADYDGIDPLDLKGKTEEEAKAFCERYGKPKGESQETGKVDSGVTSGGGKSMQSRSGSDNIREGLKKMK